MTRFVCIDVGYGDDWYITDNGKRLSEMEIVDLLNEQQAEIERLKHLLKNTLSYVPIGLRVNLLGTVERWNDE